jgi:hypothetical protein
VRSCGLQDKPGRRYLALSPSWPSSDEEPRPVEQLEHVARVSAICRYPHSLIDAASGTSDRQLFLSGNEAAAGCTVMYNKGDVGNGVFPTLSMKKPHHLMTAQERLRARIEQNREFEGRIANGHLPKHRGSGYTQAETFPVVWFWIKKLSATGIHPSHRQVVAAMLDDPENKHYAVEQVDNMVSFFSQTKTVDENEKTAGKRNPYSPLFDQVPVDGCYVFILKDRLYR